MAIDWLATMRGFIGRLGLERLDQDEDGTYTLYVGEGPPVFLMIADDVDEVLLLGGLGKLEEERAGAAAIELLQANHFWTETGGFTLCLSPAGLDVMLVARRRLGDAPVEDLTDLFDRFSSAVLVWRARLPELGRVSEPVH